MSFVEVREYSTAMTRDSRLESSAPAFRTRSPNYLKKKELTHDVLITSTSNRFGTTGKRKKDLVTEIASVLCFSAISNNDKIGAVFQRQGREVHSP